MPIGIYSNNLKDIRVLNKSGDPKEVHFMMKYVYCLTKILDTAELRSYWTIVYKWIIKNVEVSR
jgi:hypothetical protein